MIEDTLEQAINALVNGTITEVEHQWLQNRLKVDVNARAIFRERMDIESGLRTWAADSGMRQSVLSSDSENKKSLRIHWGWHIAWIASAASILAIGLWWTEVFNHGQFQLADEQNSSASESSEPTLRSLGEWTARADCIWEQRPALVEGTFKAGMIKLISGAAELRFDSGTNVTLEGPCELLVNSADSARLVAGSVFVNVTEVSNGFLLETPDAQIIDEGTQYAVALDSQATEVHVFDGNVIWAPILTDLEFEDRIASGEARRYVRNEPGRSRRIPFGQRQFVRRIEEQMRETAGESLIAYDGFENLAGQLRRDRSGFGWAGGWESAGFGRGPLAEVIDAPNDIVFGKERSGRRLLSLQGGESLRREFEKPIELSPGQAIYVSMLISRQASGKQSSDESKSDEQSSAIQIVLEPDSVSPRFMRRHSVTLGVRSDQRLFVNNSGTVDEVATLVAVDEPLLFVLMYKADSGETCANLRVYRVNELVDTIQPSVWSVYGTASAGPLKFGSIRITLGSRAAAQIDELRISDSWSAAVDLTK